MIILSQSVTSHFISFFDIFRFAKSSKIILFQSVSGVKNFVRLLLQSASDITKCDSYYKERCIPVGIYLLLTLNIFHTLF